MQQTRIMSLVEVTTGSLIGFVVAVLANYFILPLFGFQVKLSESFAITLMFMGISIIRGYLVRRFFASFVTKFASWFDRIYSSAMALVYRDCAKPEFPTYYETPPDWEKCRNLVLDGPTPCWYPHCGCFKN